MTEPSWVTFRFSHSQPWLYNGGLEPSAYFDVNWFAAKVLTITIKSGDWGVWKSIDGGSVDTLWLQSLLDSPNLRDVQNFRLELELDAGEEEKLDNVAALFSSLRGRYFRRHGGIAIGSWSKGSMSLFSFNSAAICSTRTIIWKSRRLREGLRKHPTGYWIRDGELKDCLNEMQNIMAKVRKRGAKRSMPRHYRKH